MKNKSVDIRVWLFTGLVVVLLWVAFSAVVDFQIVTAAEPVDRVPYQIETVLVYGPEPVECFGSPGCATVCHIVEVNGDVEMDCLPVRLYLSRGNNDR